jgi:hypothetical protein
MSDFVTTRPMSAATIAPPAAATIKGRRDTFTAVGEDCVPEEEDGAGGVDAAGGAPLAGTCDASGIVAPENPMSKT